MGKRGPKPAPTAIKIAKGTQPCRINYDEPPALLGDPEPPAPLDGLALVEWNRILPILRQLGVLSRSDGAAIAIYCEAFARYESAEAIIAERGMVTEDEKGRYRLNPALAISDKAVDVMRRFFAEFGLTPSARSSIKADPAAAREAEDELDAFLANRKTPRGKPSA